MREYNLRIPDHRASGTLAQRYGAYESRKEWRQAKTELFGSLLCDQFRYYAAPKAPTHWLIVTEWERSSVPLDLDAPEARDGVPRHHRSSPI